MKLQVETPKDAPEAQLHPARKYLLIQFTKLVDVYDANQTHVGPSSVTGRGREGKTPKDTQTPRGPLVSLPFLSFLV